MVQSSSTGTTSPEQIRTPAIDLDDPLASRTYRLKPPRNRWVKYSRWIADSFESSIAHRSKLPDLPVFQSHQFPWVAAVEREWREIRKELDEVLKRREEIPSFQDILAQAGSITNDNQWKTFFLIGPGMECRENQLQCPNTMRILKEVPKIHTAFFSILSPRKHIPAHRGPFNGVLRFHLGLMVPEPKEHCRIRIGTTTHHWEEGQSLIFDDTYNHEVWNDTDGHRVVLFVDFARPMKAPWQPLLDAILKIGSYTPFLREAGQRQKKWEKRFYKKKAPTEKVC